MTRHLLKLIWNRRRTNFLVILEIFLSFLALFGIVAIGVFYADNERQPLGFDPKNVWLVELDNKGAPEYAASYWRLYRTLADLPQVEAVTSHHWGAPYHPPQNHASYQIDGRRYDYGINRVSDDFAKVLGLSVVRGRWFSREDDAAGIEPVVINERLAKDAFGGEEAVGRRMPREPNRDGRPQAEWRVVGVVREYRPQGELTAPEGYLFARQAVGDTSERMRGSSWMIRMRPGTPRGYEEQVMSRLLHEAPTWTFRIRALDEWRADSRRDRIAPLIALGLIVGFLLLMVVLGLLGVLWQNVTQRTQEIGLRRAKGATARRIQQQILGEVVVMTTFAVAAGTLVVVQLPLLDALGFLSPGVMAASLVISAAAIYVLTSVCGFYPARLATRVQPAEALHYE